MGGRGVESDEDEITGGGGGGQRTFIPRVMLRDDGEFCRIRFLTEHDDIFWELHHRNMVGGDFRGYALCTKSATGEDCAFCNKGVPANKHYFAWVYELSHFYPLTERAKETIKRRELKGKKVKEGKQTFYRVDTEEVLLMQYSGYHFGAVEKRAERHGTLLDRPFEWIRNGQPGDTDTSYIFEALDEELLSKELRGIAADLPDLEDVVLGRVSSLDSKEAASDDEDPFEEESAKDDNGANEEEPF